MEGVPEPTEKDKGTQEPLSAETVAPSAAVLSEAEHLKLQKAGANACATGLTVLDNPSYKRANLPATTGETLEVWKAKHDAWELGWTLENAMRA